MLLKFGGYSFPFAQVEVKPSMQADRDESGRPYQYNWTIDCDGLLLADTAVAEANAPLNLTTYDLILRASTSLIERDLILFDDSGRPTSIDFRNSVNMIGPVQCVYMGYPDGGAGEYVTKRTFRARFVVTYQTPARYGTWISYRETVQILGSGGPLIHWQLAVNGPPVPVQVYPETTIRVIVAGQLVGYENTPQIQPPHPAIPAVFLQNPQWALSLSSPKWSGNSAHRNREFPCSWNYVYEGRVSDLKPSLIVPRAWPVGR